MLDRQNFIEEKLGRQQERHWIRIFYIIFVGILLLVCALVGISLLELSVLCTGILIFYGGLHIVLDRDRTRCPECGKKLALRLSESLIARHCYHCGSALFSPKENAHAYYPEMNRIPALPLHTWLGHCLGKQAFLVLLLIGEMCTIFYYFGNQGYEFPASPILAAMLGAILLLIALIKIFRNVLLLGRASCPICDLGMSLHLVNGTGDCNRCGARMLDTLPALPEADLPDFETIREYRKICRKGNGFMAIVVILYLLFVPACIFLKCNLYWIPAGAVVVFFCWIIKEFLLGIMQRKRHLTGRCPNCGKPTGRPEQLTIRCPHCMRRTVRFADQSADQ